MFEKVILNRTPTFHLLSINIFNTYNCHLVISMKTISQFKFYFFILVLLQLSQFSPPHCSPLPCPRPAPTVSPHPVVHVHGSFIHVPWLDPTPSFPTYTPLPPLSLPWVYSLFPCLWFYFPHLFVLFIRFLLYVRSYGICLSPSGLFHLA